MVKIKEERRNPFGPQITVAAPPYHKPQAGHHRKSPKHHPGLNRQTFAEWKGRRKRLTPSPAAIQPRGFNFGAPAPRGRLIDDKFMDERKKKKNSADFFLHRRRRVHPKCFFLLIDSDELRDFSRVGPTDSTPLFLMNFSCKFWKSNDTQ